MPKHKMTDEERNAKQKARYTIIYAANKARFLPGAYTMKHLQRCVSIVRAQQLVAPHVLVTAGFNE